MFEFQIASEQQIVREVPIEKDDEHSDDEVKYILIKP